MDGFRRRAVRRLEPKENCPMTVRWKPLLILSGVFVVVLLVGVVVIMLALVPRSSQGILKMARGAREAGRFENSEIYYKQALQLEAKNAAIHEEFANLYRDWMNHAAAEKQTALRTDWLDHLLSAAKFDKTAKGPRRQLLKDAMIQDQAGDAVRLAKDLLIVDADNLDAHYVLAAEALEARTPNVPEIRRHLKVLDDKQASPIRRLWIRAKLADTNGDEAGRDEAFTQAAKTTLQPDADPNDRMADIRIVSLAVRSQNDPARLEIQVRNLLKHVKELGKPEDLPPARVARLRVSLEQTQKDLTKRSDQVGPTHKKAVEALVGAIDVDLESIFKQALSGKDEPDLQTFLTYADHLRFRQQRDRCLEVIDQALQSPQATRRTANSTLLSLRSVAVEMALSNVQDNGRFERAAPHIQALLDSTDPRFQGLGHLFAGSVDFERSGMAREMGAERSTAKADPKLRTSALNHLRLAATELPDIAEAQARYGVVLVLAGEQNAGRQFLQNALRLGSLEPHYQLCAAWTILQAGYPEEAEPIVAALLSQVNQGNGSPDLEAALHLLNGELHQAKRTPDDLKQAVAEFDKALASEHTPTASVVLRLAQIDVQLGQHERALKRLDNLTAQGKGEPNVEQLAVLTLEEQGKKSEARARLKAARSKYRRSADLAAVDAALLAKDGKPEEADKTLDQFLSAEPDNPKLVMMRAALQAESLKNPDKARVLLNSIADRVDYSDPLVQLAALELEQNQLDAAAAVIARIRLRWSEAATSDVLEAQLALKRGNAADAISHFETALKKDPDNKIVQYWKAQLDSRNGAVEEATRSFEAIVRNKPLKEVDPGTTLMSAAQSALANLSLQAGEFDKAIRRFEDLKRNSRNGTLSKPDRWQLITAYVTKGNWPVAKSEIAAILSDAKNPAGDDERVRAANFYRQKGEEALALAQLDTVLETNPTNQSAVVTRSYILLKAKKNDQALAILRKAIDLSNAKSKAPASFYLMLAAVENETEPKSTALKRALAVLDQGLERSPDAPELVQTKYVAMKAGGDVKAAIALVEAKAKEFPKGPFRKLLVEVYKDQKDFTRAEQLLGELCTESPDDATLAAGRVLVLALDAADAAARNQSDREREINDKAAALIGSYRIRFPKDLAFPQAECDLIARRGDFARALEMTREIDKLSPESPLGPILRSRLFTALNKPREVAQAYAEALERTPRQLDLRMLLGETKLKLGEADEALRQARLVLEVDQNRREAVLLEARALAEAGTTASQKKAYRQQAVGRLEAAVKADPHFDEAYHALADVALSESGRAAAIAVWKEDLKNNPGDATALARLIEAYTVRQPGGKPPAEADLAEAKRLAAEVAGRDTKGHLILALAIGFHKTGQLELAFPYAEAAAAKLDTPSAHLNLGDLLLTFAESQADPIRASASFERAVDQYNLVLKSQPNSVQAVNNKAWILHSYLKKSQPALDIILDLRKRVNAAFLPGEFFDTLGAIQEAVGHAGDAEQSFLEGLKRSPENPVLNFHFGKLILSDRDRASKARTYLMKALRNRDRLSAPMAEEAVRLVQLIDNQGKR
jgi:cellulose synthase operon protein C